ncbi:hypothetical protein ACUUL3_15920 [Thiovibrio sp. JS02]
MGTAEKIYAELKELPPPLAEEVLDFIAFIKARRLRDERGEDAGWTLLQEKSLAEVWDNNEDEAWNDVRVW